MFRGIPLIAALALAGAAHAQSFDYNYIEGFYGKVEYDVPGGDFDGDGFGLAGSFAVADNFHVFGSYSSVDFDLGVDATDFSVGLGYNTPISDTVDVVARLAYVSAEFDIPNFGSVDDDGYAVGVGLRGMAMPQLELHGDVSYVDLGGSGSGDTSFGAGFLYHFTESLAAGLSGDWGDDVSSYVLSGRVSFGR